MKHVRRNEILCVLVLCVFVFLLLTQGRQSSADPAAVFDAVRGAVSTETLALCKPEKFKKEFGQDAQAFDGVFYMASDSVMEVREILLVKLPDGADSEALVDRIRQRVEEKITLFDGYAPQQCGYLKDYALLVRSGFVLFVVSNTPDAAVRAFKKAISV